MNRKQPKGLGRFDADFMPVERWGQLACKPGSVGPKVVRLRKVSDLKRGGHSSGTVIADRLKQPTRTTSLEAGLARTPVVPIRFCSWWGLPCRPHYCVRGALLPHPFTLTPGIRRSRDPRTLAGRSALCGTFPRVTPAGRYPAPCFHGARTFLPERTRSGRPAS